MNFLGGSGNPADSGWAEMRDALAKEPELIIVFGSELRGEAVASLVRWGLQHPAAKFICLGDYSNSRGAADMGLYPHLLPGYTPVDSAATYTAEYGEIPIAAGLDIEGMFAAANAGKLGALYVVGANPVVDYECRSSGLAEHLRRGP